MKSDGAVRRDQGYTLVELVVVIFIFAVVMALISVSFNRIVSSSGQIVKSGETDIGGLIGLEFFRCDLELAGFGLPWSFPDNVLLTYVEIDPSKGVLMDGCPDGCPNAQPSKFNDSPPAAPRAYIIGNNVGYNGSDYLVLKGTALGMKKTSRKWSYLNYSSIGDAKPSKSEVELTPGNSDWVISLRTGFRAGQAVRELVTDGSTFQLLFNTPFPDAFKPTSKQDVFLVYGVDDSSPTFPFNRADYFISRNDKEPYKISPICAPGTGLLIKAVINQNGSVTHYPILECVADMQVVLYLDTNGDGQVDFHSNSQLAASDLREQLKEIRVYILAQQGKKDPGYSYPVTDSDKAMIVGDAGLDPSLGRWWSQTDLSNTFGPDWRNYHWKVYTIVVQPKNL